MLSWSSNRGGAARAANRLFNAIQEYESKEIKINMLVNDRVSESNNLIGPKSNIQYGWNLIRRYAGIKFQELQKTNNQIFHSSSLLPSNLDYNINRNDSELINLHWVQGEMLSIRSIGRIKKPIVYTLHDSWAFLGSEHHPNGYEDKRYIEGYWKYNRPSKNRGLDIDRISWQMKKKYWKTPFHIVCPSKWMADCAKKSMLMKDWPISVIPNTLSLNTFRPVDKIFSRKIFNLDLDKKFILLSALKPSSNFNKGWDLLEPALIKISSIIPNLELIVIGENKPIEIPKLGMKINYLGNLYDDQSLAIIYSASDLVVVPSRIESFSQAASESQSCGTPVLAFDCSGLSDVVSHKKTGYLAKPFEVESLVKGMQWILEDINRTKAISQKSRERALNLWDPSRISKSYKNLYKKVLSEYKRKKIK